MTVGSLSQSGAGTDTYRSACFHLSCGCGEEARAVVAVVVEVVV